MANSVTDSNVSVGSLVATRDKISNSKGGQAVMAINIDSAVFRTDTTSAGTGFFLPAGASIVNISAVVRGNGASTVDIGTESDADAFANNLSMSASTAGATPVAAWEGAGGAVGGDPVEIFMSIAASTANLQANVIIQYIV